MDPHEDFDEVEVEEIRSYIQDGDLSGAFERIKDHLEDLENAPLNIAVTGESGTGKSTFVNTFLGLSGEDAAETGVVETTMEPKAYSHPIYKNVRCWDLPGIGSPNFKAEDYLDTVHFADYDFFVIIASERFRENNLQLARAIQNMTKNFYFVRSKIGQDMYSAKIQRGKSFNEETILKEIREDCLKCFMEADINSKVYLIDCLEECKFDFEALQEAMEKELPLHKRHVFLMSLPNISLAVLEKKREALRQQLWQKAFLCSAACFNIVGIASNDSVLEKTMREYQTVFGLDDNSLNKLSQLSGKSVSDLKSVIKSPQVIEEINKESFIQTISHVTTLAALLADRLQIRIAMFGSLAAGSVAHYVMMYQMLKRILSASAEDAQRVLIKACEDEV